MLALGGLERNEEYRDRRGVPALESLVRDRYGARTLIKSPASRSRAYPDSGPGIGVNSAILPWSTRWS